MLKIENLRAFYDNIPALKSISIEVAEGKVVSIIGANGAGKSTMLKSISGLIRTQEGRIFYKGRDIAGCQECRSAGRIPEQVSYDNRQRQRQVR